MLVNCVVYEQGARLADIAVSDIRKHLANPGCFSGIYGMNFDHMPELERAWGYPAALGSMVAIDLYLVDRFRAAQWM